MKKESKDEEFLKRIKWNRKKILTFSKYADGKETKSYSEGLFNRVVDFFLSEKKKIYENCNKIIEFPHFVAEEDGDIGLFWQTKKLNLILTFPNNAGESITYYGDNRKHNKKSIIIDGDFDPKKDSFIDLYASLDKKFAKN
jgi:hypothetical protein